MFDEFWTLYPRKEGKKPARMIWDRMKSEQQQQAIEALPLHCKRWLLKGTDSEFIPHARTWLFQERWEDEIELKESSPQWWASDNSTMDKGRELGCHARPGEDMNGYRERIRKAIAK
jgi:hypothetical protein